VTQGAADLTEFEAFASRASHTALLLWAAAVLVGLVACRACWSIPGGILLGGAASLAALRYKVWVYRRLADRPTPRRARRLPLASAGRYAILGAAVALAVWLSTVTGQAAWLPATAGALLVSSAATVVQAVRESRSAAR
jgi:hypothetical protein